MTRRLAIVALAVLLAIVGTVAVYSYAHNADQRALDKTRAAHVVIVSKQVPAGVTWQDAIKGGYLKEDKIPVDSTPSDAVASLSASIPLDQVATADIPAGSILLRQMFGQKTAVTGVLPITKGKIAVTVSMGSAGDVAGFPQPGSEVIIFSTFKVTAASTGSSQAPNNPDGSLGGSDVYATKMLLPRVEVLATSQSAPGDLNGGKNGTTGDSKLVTLALTQQEAERVILAQQVGQLYMGLLSDSSVTGPDGGSINVGKFKPTPIFLD